MICGTINAVIHCIILHTVLQYYKWPNYRQSCTQYLVLTYVVHTAVLTSLSTPNPILSVILHHSTLYPCWCSTICSTVSVSKLIQNKLQVILHHSTLYPYQCNKSCSTVSLPSIHINVVQDAVFMIRGGGTMMWKVPFPHLQLPDLTVAALKPHRRN